MDNVSQFARPLAYLLGGVVLGLVLIGFGLGWLVFG